MPTRYWKSACDHAYVHTDIHYIVYRDVAACACSIEMEADTNKSPSSVSITEIFVLDDTSCIIEDSDGSLG